MQSIESTLGSFVEQLPIAQREVIAGVAQEALLGAGITVAGDCYLTALGDPYIQELPGITAAKERVYDTFAALCMGLPAPDEV